MRYRLGIDLGGTSAKIALISPNKRIKERASVSSTRIKSVGALIKEVAGIARGLTNGKKPVSAGVGVAGDVDFSRGIVRQAPNLKWRNVPLKSLMQRYLKCPVTVDNDANVAAWGIYKTQVPASVKNLIVLTLGTGVGGGIIIDGHVHRGSTGTAGEIGHMTMIEGGRLCNCGDRGCLETYAGGLHLVRVVKKELKAGKRSSLQKLDPSEITPRAIAEAANRGDKYAKSHWNSMGHLLGLAVGDLTYIINPDRIIFTGGVAQAGNLILKPLKQALKKRTFKSPMKALKIEIAKKAPNVGVIGAALL